MSTSTEDIPAPTSYSNAPSKQPAGASTAIAIGVTCGLVVLAVLGLLVYFWIYRPYRREAKDPEDRRRETVVGPGHMASHVTPFYPFRGEGPRFAHRPGEGMRVAYRRADGGWDFADPLAVRAPVTPFREAGSSAGSSPTASVFTTLSASKKEKKQPGDLTTRGFVEPYMLEPAPPAYTRNASAPATPRTSMGEF